ncbi:MAG: ribonuclease III family protein [Candidatus Heimdallarchaeota archaeon]|nr:ribonuclease III family protein [Candidatus Heimdallarchaeota archaeon]
MVKIDSWMDQYSISCSRTKFKEAITHPSVRSNSEHKMDYEQLETIGDAVLDLLILDYILKLYPDASPSQLTRGRSNIVNNHVLGKAAKKLELDTILITDSGYEITNRDLSNSLEAIVGAIYQDSGLDSCKQLLDGLMPLLEKIINEEYGGLDINALQSNPIGRLQDFLQKNNAPLPIYSLISKSGPDNDPTFDIVCLVEYKNTIYSEHGHASSKKRGKEIAARKILKRLNKH